MTTGFWSALRTPIFILAPMADVTDLPFRTIVRELGLVRGEPGSRPDVFYTEFVSADGLASAGLSSEALAQGGRPRLLPYLAFDEAERPVVAQFFGANPSHIREAASLARELGFDGVDINMGCPERKVVKQGAGIGLCKDPARAREIIAAAKEGAGSLPVSVKTRLGWGDISLPWIEAILDCGVAALAVHLRTMKEMSAAPAHWEYMREIAEMAHAKGTLALGNGDVKSVEEGREKCAKSGADGVMIGRGIFENPWLFSQSENSAERPEGLFSQSENSPEFAGGLVGDRHTVGKEERLRVLLRHTRLFTEFWGARKNFAVMKRFFKVYISNWDGAKELRARLMEAKDAGEVEKIVLSEVVDREI